MTTFLNLALLIIGTAATLAAFGGKTWKEGSQPILERVTSRGWISLICLILALGLGVAKEIHSQSVDRRKDEDAKNAKAKADLEHLVEVSAADRRQAALSEQLAKAQAELKGLREVNDVTNDNLKDVRGDLKATRGELSQQSTATVVSAFANGNQVAKELKVVLALTPLAEQNTGIRESFLLEFEVRECRTVTILAVNLRIGSKVVEHITYPAGDELRVHQYGDESLPVDDNVDLLTDQQDYFIQEDDKSYLGSYSKFHTSIRKDHSKHVIFGPLAYNLRLDTSHLSIAASELYGLYSNPRQNPFYIEVGWPNDYEVPEKCLVQVGEYLRKAFDKGVLLLALNDKRDETIIFRLKALPPVAKPKRKGVHGIPLSPSWILPFVSFSVPQFANGVDPDMDTRAPDDEAEKTPN
jgi:hypothetical protein